MKFFSILAVTLLLAFIVVQLFALKSQYGIETHSYQIQKQFQNFEIRRYDKALFSSVSFSIIILKMPRPKVFLFWRAIFLGIMKGMEK